MNKIESFILYIITFSLSLIFCYIYEKKVDKTKFLKRLIWTFIIIAPTVVLAGLRYDVGIDYIEYEKHFYQNKFENGFNYFIKEPLNFLIMIVTYAIYPNSTIMFFAYAFIIMFVFFKAIEQYRNRISITLALFVFYMTYYLVSFSIIRQMTSVIIILYGLRYIFKKDFLKWLICIVLAGMIHKTSYPMIFLYFLNSENIEFLNKINIFKNIKNKINYKYQNIITYLILIILPLSLTGIIPIVIEKIGIYKSYLKYETNLSFSFLLYVLPVLIIVFLKRKEILEENKNNEFFIRTLILQIPFQIMGGLIKYTDRFSLYVGIVQVILMPIIFKNLTNNKKDKLIKLCIIGWYVFYFIVMIAILNSNRVLPYRTIFNK